MRSAHRQAAHAKRYTRDPMAMFRVIGRAQSFTQDEQAQLKLPVRLAYESILKGQGTAEDFHTLAAAVNVAMVCAERIDPLVEQACIAGRDALMRVLERHGRLGRWGFDGQGMQEVIRAVEVYEQLTGLLTAGQLEDALKECHQRMRAGDVMELGQ